ncbi:MAG: cobalamin B12-binding domain-containing protein [Desulfobacteraceae bacterium]|nr:cobalamin B12-binding domain-containing protein [Desulfobacteraceae bacterium]
MRILLVYPPSGFFSYRSVGMRRPPLGLAYLASVLRDQYDVKIVDFSVEKTNWRTYPYGNFDIVGISVETPRYPISLQIAKLAKSRGAIVVTGGPHVSFMDEDALRSGVVDYVVRNEGEYAFLSLVRHLSKEIPIEEVNGISYLAEGKVSRTPDASFIRDLDSLPFPARDLLHMNLYREKTNGRPITTLVTSRGCPFRCEFCSSSSLFGSRWRARSVDNVFEEMELLYKKYKYCVLSFMDDTFTLDPGRAIRLSEKIKRQGWDLTWSALSHVTTIIKYPHMIQQMAVAGLKWVFVGFENGSQVVLDDYGKKALVKDAFKAMEILKANDIEVTGSFIIGGLNETGKMIKETIRFAKDLNPSRAQFTILTPYPGTKIYEKVKDRLLEKSWGSYTCLQPVIALDHVSPRKLRKLLFMAYIYFYAQPSIFLKNIRHFYYVPLTALRLLTSNRFFMK